MGNLFFEGEKGEKRNVINTAYKCEITKINY